ncbi:MAG: NUDIX domain-containing protein [Candidatus Nanohaloarchaea archaeon]
MRVDPGVVAVTYRENKNAEREYLLLKRNKGWTGWEMPKGHLEFGSHTATVFLELNEEAGIEPVEIKDIEDLDRYLAWQFTQDGKEVVSNFRCFRVELAEDAEPTLDKNPFDEHEEARFVSREKALEILEYDDQKELLRKETGKN